MNLARLALLGVLGVTLPLAAVVDTAEAQARAPAASKELDANTIADRVQAFYDKTKTFQSGFLQRFTIRSHDKIKDSKGTVVFEKPGKMSWRYTNNGNRVVSDGKIIKIYEQEAKQMFEQALGKSQYPAALSFLVGGGNLKKSFRLKKLNAREMQFEGGYVLLGEPREPTPAYQKMMLYVDAATYQVRRVLLLDAQGNKNRFDFVKPVVNKKPPAGEFQFTPPPGTQVIKP